MTTEQETIAFVVFHEQGTAAAAAAGLTAHADHASLLLLLSFVVCVVDAVGVKLEETAIEGNLESW